MPLEPYYYQPAGSKHTTPSPIIPQGGHSRRASNASLWSSPGSVDTRATTPTISPSKGLGRDILPRIRPVDQGLEADFAPASLHRKTQSYQYDLDFDLSTSRPAYGRAVTCPPEAELFSDPVSAPPQDPWAYADIDSSLFYTPSPAPRNGNHGHVKSTSTSSLDPALLRYSFPYRTVPQYITQETPSDFYQTTIQPSLLEYPSNLYVPHQPSSLARELTPEFLFSTGTEPTITLNSYLTSPNPAIHLLPSGSTPKTHPQRHFWWDIRQVSSWDSFKLSSVLSVPSFPELLSIDINASALPEPPTSTAASNPANHRDLHATLNDHFTTKLNAALKATQGEGSHGYMSSAKSEAHGPYWITRYVRDQNTIPSKRARVVGLARGYRDWNTGMRRGDPIARVEYLRTLAHLHCLMREQECRYGFILTEIELVCVRLPACSSRTSSSSSSSSSKSKSSKSTSTSTSHSRSGDKTPLFGTLEISSAIPLDRTEGLTACMALWYLHMLTADRPLVGQEHWWADIGAPADHTRAKCCDDEGKDRWIREVKPPQIKEMRTARQSRGWIWPRDAYCPKLEGRTEGARSRARGSKRS